MRNDRPEVAKFFSRIHVEVFKPRGFTKTRRTFTKKYESFSVAFQFQGSSWNDQTSPWRFYLNAGIQFHEIPRRNPDKDFPTIHSWMRVGTALSRSADPQYDVLHEMVEDLLKQIEAVVTDCMNYFSTSHLLLEKAYRVKAVPYLGYLDETLMKKNGKPNQAVEGTGDPRTVRQSPHR